MVFINLAIIILLFWKFSQFLASKLGFRRRPAMTLRLMSKPGASLLSSLLSPLPWSSQVSLSWIQALLSLPLELSNFTVHACILFVEASW